MALMFVMVDDGDTLARVQFDGKEYYDAAELGTDGQWRVVKPAEVLWGGHEITVPEAVIFLQGLGMDLSILQAPPKE